MNVNNQPSFGASFRWSTSGMAQKVSENMSPKSLESLSETVQSLKGVGGDNVQHILLPSPKFLASNYSSDKVNSVFSYMLATVLKKVDGSEIRMKSQPGEFEAAYAQRYLDALNVAEKHNLSQDKIDEFGSPEDIVKYGKALDLEG